MRVIIAGSRDIYLTTSEVAKLLHKHNLSPTEIVCGMAKGVDKSGLNWAKSHNIPVKRFHPNWDKFGLRAGPLRNEQMAEYGEVLLLIWTGKSKGSANMKQNMMKLNKQIFEEIV